MDATKWHRRVLSVLFIVYLILLFYFLFFSEGFGRTQFGEEYRYNLTLFKEITRFIRYRHLLGFKEVIINISGYVIAIIPIRYILPKLHTKKLNRILVVIHCFLLSLLVEVIQLVFRLGCFDVDDLFLNTLGGLLGYLTYFIIKTIRNGKDNQ